MTILHNQIQHAECHEPRHITTSGAVDAGKVITPSAASPGTSELRKLKPSELNDETFLFSRAYGGKTVRRNTTVIALVAASDPTNFAQAADYSLLTGIYQSPEVAPALGITQATNSLTVLKKGIYRIDFWATLAASTVNTTVAFNFGLNGVVDVDRPVTARMPAAGDKTSTGAHAYITLNAGDVVTLWAASNTATNLTVHNGRYSLELVQETV